MDAFLEEEMYLGIPALEILPHVLETEKHPTSLGKAKF